MSFVFYVISQRQADELKTTAADCFSLGEQIPYNTNTEDKQSVILHDTDRGRAG